MSIFEYDEEDTRRAIRKYEREQGREEGRAEGKAEAVLLLLNGKGELPVALQEEILRESNLETLKSWLVAAAKAKNVEEFIEKISVEGR